MAEPYVTQYLMVLRLAICQNYGVNMERAAYGKAEQMSDKVGYLGSNKAGGVDGKKLETCLKKNNKSKMLK